MHAGATQNRDKSGRPRAPMPRIPQKQSASGSEAATLVPTGLGDGEWAARGSGRVTPARLAHPWQDPRENTTDRAKIDQVRLNEGSGRTPTVRKGFQGASPNPQAEV
ncbi:hypothetical protein NL676_034989 [Syzygium grande]|nr:hypothetical protein NL676_034989 [Syzygium grande]